MFKLSHRDYKEHIYYKLFVYQPSVIILSFMITEIEKE